MPCMEAEGLTVFPVTANQRIMLGEDIFLQTHWPIRLLNKSDEHISEVLLLEHLNDTTGLPPGNRVFVLIGASGSGKSELMAWLELMLCRQSTELPIARITRTDLDALSIIERFRHWLTGSYFERATHDRWQQMRRKPRTLAKLLVLKTLEMLLEDDDLINALYYRLVDLVEDRIRDVLQINQPPDARHVDILTRREFEEGIANTVLPVPLTFEVFRQTLLSNLTEYLLEGVRIRETLQALSSHFHERGQRPILLIDDLVQSISIFATDFLDYFITLEAGHWDIVVGLTPASLQKDPRHREILERITYLDTIDDRVEKLWLSDEGGLRSFFLEEDNCHSFAFSYLQAFRQINGLDCESCPALKRCRTIATDDNILAPFTHEALVRMYRAIPTNKGRVRYFLMAIRSVLQGWLNNATFVDLMHEFAQIDLAIEHYDPEIRALLKWYAPLDANQQFLQPSQKLLDFFGFETQSVNLPIQALVQSNHEEILTIAEYEPRIDPTMVAIAKWLEGKPTNRQLLHDLRKGAARWLKAIMPVDVLHRDGIAPPTQALRYRRVEMSTSPPIALQGVDDYDGILITQEIGHNAYRLAKYFKSTGKSAKSLEHKLNADERMLEILLTAQQFRQHVWRELEDALGMPLYHFAFCSAVLVWLHTDVPSGMEALVPAALYESLKLERQQINLHGPEITEALARQAQSLFDDFFCLRRNLYDGERIWQLGRDAELDALIARLETLEAKKISPHFILDEQPLAEYVAQLQQQIEALLEGRARRQKLDSLPLSSTVHSLLGAWQRGDNAPLRTIDADDLRSLQQFLPDIYERLVVKLGSC